MPLPVAVVVAHLASRSKFFVEVCLPTIMENDPAQILVQRNSGGMTVGYWKNRAAKGVDQKYIMFVDDDTKLMPGAIEKLLSAMSGDRWEIGYAYSDFKLIVHDGVQFNVSGSRNVKAMEWNPDLLKKSNYISGVSLVRTESFRRVGGYDEELRRMVDWDLWLRLAGFKIGGKYVPETLFEAHQIDRSVTMQVSDDDALAVFRRRHPL